MKIKYVAFDIETAKVLPENEPDWNSHRPLGIACAATLLGDGNDVVLWHGGSDGPTDKMSQQEAAGLVKYLAAHVGLGYTIVTWNGLGFDLDILAEESGMLAECRELAISHVDLMFHILCRLGYGVSLDAAAKGMGLAGKPEGMNGAKAPVMWTEGKREEDRSVNPPGAELTIWSASGAVKNQSATRPGKSCERCVSSAAGAAISSGLSGRL
jgi:hypothetical protein